MAKGKDFFCRQSLLDLIGVENERAIQFKH